MGKRVERACWGYIHDLGIHYLELELEYSSGKFLPWQSKCVRVLGTDVIGIKRGKNPGRFLPCEKSSGRLLTWRKGRNVFCETDHPLQDSLVVEAAGALVGRGWYGAWQWFLLHRLLTPFPTLLTFPCLIRSVLVLTDSYYDSPPPNQVFSLPNVSWLLDTRKDALKKQSTCMFSCARAKTYRSR